MTAPEKAVMTTVYGRVVEGDEIHSANLDRWLEVSAVMGLPDGRVRITMPAMARPAGKGRPQRNAWHVFDAAKSCTIRRGPTGEVVDMFLEILYSGPSKIVREEPDSTPIPEGPA